MSDKLNLVTGATGLVGSHIAEQLCAAGERVRALVRPGADTAFLRELGVELAEGDLRDPEAVRRAAAGAAVVYHSAAKVADWGPWSAYRDETVTAMTNLVRACRAEGAARLLHVSAISVYGRLASSPEAITEDSPLGRRYWWWDYYLRSKVLAEEIARDFPATTVVRPCWIYGPRDRVTIPRVIPALLQRRVPVIGTGENYLNLIYAGDVASGAILAAEHPAAVGRAYNLCPEGEVTQRQLLDALTDALGLPRVAKRVPYAVASRYAFVQELFARLLRRSRPPALSRAAVFLIGRATRYSSARAREQLGWRPRVGVREGIRHALEWYCGLPENRALRVNPAALTEA